MNIPYRDSTEKMIGEGILRLLSTGQSERARETFSKQQHSLSAQTRMRLQELLGKKPAEESKERRGSRGYPSASFKPTTPKVRKPFQPRVKKGEKDEKDKELEDEDEDEDDDEDELEEDKPEQEVKVEDEDEDEDDDEDELEEDKPEQEVKVEDEDDDEDELEEDKPEQEVKVEDEDDDEDELEEDKPEQEVKVEDEDEDEDDDEDELEEDKPEQEVKVEDEDDDEDELEEDKPEQEVKVEDEDDDEDELEEDKPEQEVKVEDEDDDEDELEEDKPEQEVKVEDEDDDEDELEEDKPEQEVKVEDEDDDEDELVRLKDVDMTAEVVKLDAEDMNEGGNEPSPNSSPVPLEQPKNQLEVRTEMELFEQISLFVEKGKFTEAEECINKARATGIITEDIQIRLWKDLRENKRKNERPIDPSALWFVALKNFQIVESVNMVSALPEAQGKNTAIRYIDTTKLFFRKLWILRRKRRDVAPLVKWIEELKASKEYLPVLIQNFEYVLRNQDFDVKSIVDSASSSDALLRKELVPLSFPEPPLLAPAEIDEDFYTSLTEGGRRIYSVLFENQNTVVSLEDLAKAFFGDKFVGVGEKETVAIRNLIWALKKKLKAVNWSFGTIDSIPDEGYLLQTRSWVPLQVTADISYDQGKILQFLAAWERQIVTYQELEKHIWGEQEVADKQRNIQNIMVMLKEKLKKWGAIITYVDGIGYHLNLQPTLPDEIIQQRRLLLSLPAYQVLARLNENRGRTVERHILQDDYREFQGESGMVDTLELSTAIKFVRKKIGDLGTVSSESRNVKAQGFTLRWANEQVSTPIEQRKNLLPRGMLVPGVRKVRNESLLEE